MVAQYQPKDGEICIIHHSIACCGRRQPTAEQIELATLKRRVGELEAALIAIRDDDYHGGCTSMEACMCAEEFAKKALKGGEANG